MNAPIRKRGLARRDILWWAFAFVGMQIGLAVMLDSWLGICRDPDYAYRRWLLKEWIKAEPERPVVLALGTSRTMFGLRPDLLEEKRKGEANDPLVFNFGMAGYGPLHQYLELKRLLREGVRPDGIVLEIVPFTFAINPERDDNIPIQNHKWSDLEELKRLRPNALPVYREWLVARSVPFFSYRFQILSRFLPSWVPENRHSQMTLWRGIDRRGWLGTARSKSTEAALNDTYPAVHYALETMQLAPLNLKAMDEILNVCNREKIPVVVLIMPESPAFRSWYSKQAELNVAWLLEGIRTKHGVRVIDGRDWCADEEIYLDGHHLDVKGATEFTHRFGREVLPLFDHLRGKRASHADASR